MKNRTVIMSILLLCLAFLMAYGYLKSARSVSEEQNFISDLKELNGNSTFENVTMVLGEPAVISGAKRASNGQIIQSMQWAVKNGNVLITFRQKISSAPKKVISLKYKDGRGKTAYSYKTLLN